MLNRRPELATNAIGDPGVPHPRNDRASPSHFGRRPRSTQLAQAPATKTKDLCSANPVLPGPIWVTPLLRCVSHTKGESHPHGLVLLRLPGDGKAPGQDSLPTPTCRHTWKMIVSDLSPKTHFVWRLGAIITLCALNTPKLAPRPGGETQKYCLW